MTADQARTPSRRMSSSLRYRAGRIARRTVFLDGTLETMWVRQRMNLALHELLEGTEPRQSRAVEVNGDFWASMNWASHERLDCTESELAEPAHDFGARSSFDVAICDQVLQRVPDPVEGLRNLIGLVRPGGTVVVSTPFLIKIDPHPGDLWRFAPEALETMMRRVGLSDVVVDGWGNRRCVRANLRRWPQLRPWHSMRYEPEYPVVVWGRGLRPRPNGGAV